MTSRGRFLSPLGASQRAGWSAPSTLDVTLMSSIPGTDCSQRDMPLAVYPAKSEIVLIPSRDSKVGGSGGGSVVVVVVLEVSVIDVPTVVVVVEVSGAELDVEVVTLVLGVVVDVVSAEVGDEESPDMQADKRTTITRRARVACLK